MQVRFTVWSNFYDVRENAGKREVLRLRYSPHSELCTLHPVEVAAIQCTSCLDTLLAYPLDPVVVPGVGEQDVGNWLLSLRVDKVNCVKAWLAEWRALQWQWTDGPETALPVLWDMIEVDLPLAFEGGGMDLGLYVLQACEEVSVEMEAPMPIYGLEIMSGREWEEDGEIWKSGGLADWEEMEEPITVYTLWTDMLTVFPVEEVQMPTFRIDIQATKCKLDHQSQPFRFQPEALTCLLPGFQLDLPACPALSLPSNFQCAVLAPALNIPQALLLTPLYHREKDCKLLNHTLKLLDLPAMPSLWLELPVWMTAFDLPDCSLEPIGVDIVAVKVAIPPISVPNQRLVLTGLDLAKSTQRQQLIKEALQELLQAKRLPKSLAVPSTPYQSPKPSTPAEFILFNSDSTFSSSFSKVISNLKPDLSLVALPAGLLNGLDLLLSPAAGVLIRTSGMLSSEEECSRFLKELDALVGKVRRLLVLCLSRPGPRLDQWRKLIVFGELVKDLDMDCYFEVCFNESEVQDVAWWYLQQPLGAPAVYQLPAQPGPLACALTPVANIYTAMVIEQKALQGLIHPKTLVQGISSPSDLQAVSGL